MERSHLDSIDLGPLKSIKAIKITICRAATDLNKYHAAVIYTERSRAVFGLAKLEPF